MLILILLVLGLLHFLALLVLVAYLATLHITLSRILGTVDQVLHVLKRHEHEEE